MRLTSKIALGFVTMLGLSAPAFADHYRGPHYAPPAARYERYAHRAGYAYVPGRHVWNNGGYRWEGGRYEYIPRGYRAWHAGYWHHRYGNWVWVDGYWY
jgi:hypothetical protein